MKTNLEAVWDRQREADPMLSMHRMLLERHKAEGLLKPGAPDPQGCLGKWGYHVSKDQELHDIIERAQNGSRT